MKTRVEINNGHAKIVLTPENEFERTLIDNAIKEDYNEKISITREYTFGEYKNREIAISLEKKNTKEDSRNIGASLD